MKKKITITLNEENIEAIKIQAVKEHRSVGDIIDVLVSEYLKANSGNIPHSSSLHQSC